MIEKSAMLGAPSGARLLCALAAEQFFGVESTTADSGLLVLFTGVVHHWLPACFGNCGRLDLLLDAPGKLI